MDAAGHHDAPDRLGSRQQEVPAELVVRDPGAALSLAGRLDVHVAADVRTALAAQVDLGSGELLLDLAGLTSLDATGLGLLVGAHRRAGRAGRVLVLLDVAPSVGRLLLLSRLDRVLCTRRSARAA